MATRCLRYGSLAFLVAQDTALVLLMRYSRSHATGDMYLASTAVCCMEVLKLCVCVGMLYAGEARGSISGLIGPLKSLPLLISWLVVSLELPPWKRPLLTVDSKTSRKLSV